LKTKLPADYAERVYAGVLGKIIGVYLGRPFEGWTHDAILEKLGPINYYVHEQRGQPLIVSDDDISGTFTFLRALPDYGNRLDITPAQIGQTWLNYLIENRTVLWWGGMGTSTEHTAYLRLKHGIAAPRSGSMEMNGKSVAEQIGGQIFVDGWAMVSPGDPERAAALAGKAASVSHDGEGIYGAQVIAAIEATAFVETSISRLLDIAVKFIPQESTIYRLIADLRNWREVEPDWKKTREKVAERYGYQHFRGGCHMVPNHALIILGLLYGEDDFQRSLMITNTCGWDTDCNSGNVGCIMGIKNGLAGIDAGPDWRGPVADRMYLPTADGGRTFTDAASEAIEIANIGRAFAGEKPLRPKEGARYHFELPGSVQGFVTEDGPETRGVATIENTVGHSAGGTRSLAIRFRQLAPGRFVRAARAGFLTPENAKMAGYALLACPQLYPGQTVRLAVCADQANTRAVLVKPYIRHYGEGDVLVRIYGPEVMLKPAAAETLAWRIPLVSGHPIIDVGLEISSESRADGSIYLDYLTWDGAPDVTFTKPTGGGTMWQRAWVDACSSIWWGIDAERAFMMIQNEGRGMMIQGTRQWTDYRATAKIKPHMAKSFGLAARVQGLQRYYAIVLDGKEARLVKALDGDTILGRKPFIVECERSCELSIQMTGTQIQAAVDGQPLFNVQDQADPLEGGAVGILCEEGQIGIAFVTVSPVK
jgi:ADP-ribosylglycohydrolase